MSFRITKKLNFPKAALVSFMMILSQMHAFSQNNVVLCLGQDATICAGQTVTINNCNTGTNPGTAAGLYLNAPTSVFLSDDVWSGQVPIGFSFNFYGTNYSTCAIGSNGLISFAPVSGYCPWSLAGVPPLPTAALPSARNSIMIAYQDLNPATAGQVQYQTIGTAPNRKFVVLYKNVAMFGCTTQCNYLAIILYETSNIFELHIGNKPICGTWNGSLAVQGSENNPMTVAHITPGRNVSVWSANQDGRRFLPTSPSNTNSYVSFLLTNAPLFSITCFFLLYTNELLSNYILQFIFHHTNIFIQSSYNFIC